MKGKQDGLLRRSARPLETVVICLLMSIMPAEKNATLSLLTTDLPPRPRDIPVHPNQLQAYKEAGWAGYPDWLGFKRKRGVSFKLYEEAKAFVHNLGLGSSREWEAYCRGEYPHKGTRPPDIPRSPEAYYRDKGWKDYKDWLGLE